MNLFNDGDIKTIKLVLQKYIKDNGSITDSKDAIDMIDDSTDFERNKYKRITNILDYYIRYEGAVNSSNIKNVVLEIQELEEKDQGVFTKANVVVSILSAGILFLASVETNSVFFLIVIIYGLIWAYLSRLIGLKKGIDSGYIWGYFLGIIGFIVVCVLPNETEKEIVDDSNKYDNLEKLLKLKEVGAITDTEFEMEKRKLLK